MASSITQRSLSFKVLELDQPFTSLLKSDLIMPSAFNNIIKYADNINFLVPEHALTDLAAEFRIMGNGQQNGNFYDYDRRLFCSDFPRYDIIFHRLFLALNWLIVSSTLVYY